MSIETEATHGGIWKGAGRKKKVHSQLSGGKRAPLEYMLAIMNDPAADPLRRDKMAVAAAGYLHAKAGEGGKREAAQAAAQTASTGKFKPGTPPRLATVTQLPGK